MAKEKNYNPVQEQKKADKAKALRKQKANVQAQRNEKLARRNPARIQRDIDQLKDLEQSGALRPHERQRLTELEKDLAAVTKARAALGDKAPQFKPERRHEDSADRSGREQGRGRGGGGVLGKRTRDGQRKDDDSSDTDADVANIPMPRDTPPPIPRQRQRKTQDEEAAPPEPKKAQIVYEAAPQKRDFLKEATKFMPAAVAQKMKLAKGEGRLLEPEEFDKLREDGYMGKEKDETVPKAEVQAEVQVAADPELEVFLKRTAGEAAGEAAEQAVRAAIEEAEYSMMAAEAQGKIHGISSEAAVAENTLRHVEIEEVEDEDL
ncbi:WW domain binding protein 11 [Stagonosporopsis vannaccii]|nr:WW domain binding protein 11 [Stagonosporopsis vannaccii]